MSRWIFISVLFLGQAAPHCAAGVNVDRTLHDAKWQPEGEWRTAEIPDTLDLAQRAEYALTNLTHNVDPERYYSVYQTVHFSKGKLTSTADGVTWNITPKNARALTLMRVMCGSYQGVKVQEGMIRTLLTQIHPDGLMYYPIADNAVPVGTSYPFANGLVGLVLLDNYERDRNPEWLEWLKLVSNGLKRIPVQVEDRAYYPPECAVRPDGTWFWNTREGSHPYYPYKPPEEMTFDQQGYEGSAKFEQAQSMRTLAKCYQVTGQKNFLEMSEKIARFCLKPGMWEYTSAEGFQGNEHGQFAGHFHGNLTALYALLDLAIITGDERLKQVVREGWDQARRNGVIRMGFFPSWIKPDKYKRPAGLHGVCEGCGVSDALILAVKLSDAGLGDYWDDADAIVRNQLTEQQIVDLDQMRRIAGEDNPLLEQFRGGFCQAGPTSAGAGMGCCCSANGAIGLYYAWHGITRFDHGVATVNLWLNRAAPWMDIDSYLPYEGKLVLHNHQAQTALVHVPGWLNRGKLQCFVNNKVAAPVLAGPYLVFEKLKKKDEIRLEFAVPESMERDTIDGKLYTLTLRGSTVVDIQPRDTNPANYWLYQRAGMKAGPAPLRKMTRFIANEPLPLQ